MALSRLWAKYRMLCRFRPAIDIRPFNGMYTWARSVNAVAWLSLIPVNLGRERASKNKQMTRSAEMITG